MNIVLIIAILYLFIRILYKEYRAPVSSRGSVIVHAVTIAIFTSILIAILS